MHPCDKRGSRLHGSFTCAFFSAGGTWDRAESAACASRTAGSRGGQRRGLGSGELQKAGDTVRDEICEGEGICERDRNISRGGRQNTEIQSLERSRRSMG